MIVCGVFCFAHTPKGIPYYSNQLCAPAGWDLNRAQESQPMIGVDGRLEMSSLLVASAGPISSFDRQCVNSGKNQLQVSMSSGDIFDVHISTDLTPTVSRKFRKFRSAF